MSAKQQMTTPNHEHERADHWMAKANKNSRSSSEVYIRNARKLADSAMQDPLTTEQAIQLASVYALLDLSETLRSAQKPVDGTDALGAGEKAAESILRPATGISALRAELELERLSQKPPMASPTEFKFVDDGKPLHKQLAEIYETDPEAIRRALEAEAMKHPELDEATLQPVESLKERAAREVAESRAKRDPLQG